MQILISTIDNKVKIMLVIIIKFLIKIKEIFPLINHKISKVNKV
jgi:hypothetical protein